MKKESQRQFPVKNTFIYPSGKKVEVMANSRPAQASIEDDWRKVMNDTQVKISWKKEFYYQWNSPKPVGVMV